MLLYVRRDPLLFFLERQLRQINKELPEFIRWRREPRLFVSWRRRARPEENHRLQFAVNMLNRDLSMLLYVWRDQLLFFLEGQLRQINKELPDVSAGPWYLKYFGWINIPLYSMLDSIHERFNSLLKPCLFKNPSALLSQKYRYRLSIDTQSILGMGWSRLCSIPI